MLERPEQIGATADPLEKWPYFKGTPSSKDFLAAKKFTENFIITEKFEGDLEDTLENVEQLREFLENLGRRLGPGISVEGIINELRAAKVITEPVVEKREKKRKEAEFLETNYAKLETPREVQLDEEQQKIIEANLLFEEMEKQNVFKNNEELETVYNTSLELHKSQLESNDYYYEFAKKGLIRGGEDEVKEDLLSLEERKKTFEERKSEDQKQRDKLERAKKIATITERVLVYAVTELSWYGKDVTIEPVSEFDDIKRGVDDVLEIRKGDDESGFLALGIDVTFRGLYSEQFKQKFSTLLQSIYDGYKTKVKYFKNHKGELMKEFAVPKMALYFNVMDVKDMVEILKQKDGGQELREYPQKEAILYQIIQSCTLLAAFASEYQNDIANEYKAVLDSINELGQKNENVKKIIEMKHSDEVSKHLKELIEEFKLIKAQEKAVAA